jgi:hypothetical protein
MGNGAEKNSLFLVHNGRDSTTFAFNFHGKFQSLQQKFI